MSSDKPKYGRRNVKGTVYLIHFETPYRHAKHYLGWTGNLEQRIKAHASGEGSPLMAAVQRAGIDWRLARTWENVDRYFERKLHHRHGTRLCPICTRK